MSEASKSAASCLILCTPQLVDLYLSHFEKVAEECGLELRFVNDPGDFTQQCLERSPVAGLIDLGSIIGGDTEKMNQLFDYRVRWPVIRCQIGSDGTGQFMQMRPPLQRPSPESLGEICRGDSAWTLADQTRHHLRVRVRCRGRIGVAGSEPSRRVNIATLSQAGCLMFADEPPEPGTKLSLEIRDLPGGEVRLDAEVAWCWKWQDSIDPPRAGLRFSDSVPPAAIARALGDHEFASELC